MKRPRLYLVTLTALAMLLGGLVVFAQADQTLEIDEDAPPPAFVLPVARPTTCFPWTADSCDGDVCTYTVHHLEESGATCLGAVCLELLGDDAVSIELIMRNETAQFCGEPIP